MAAQPGRQRPGREARGHLAGNSAKHPGGSAGRQPKRGRRAGAYRPGQQPGTAVRPSITFATVSRTQKAAGVSSSHLWARARSGGRAPSCAGALPSLLLWSAGRNDAVEVAEEGKRELGPLPPGRLRPLGSMRRRHRGGISWPQAPCHLPSRRLPCWTTPRTMGPSVCRTNQCAKHRKDLQAAAAEVRDAL